MHQRIMKLLYRSFDDQLTDIEQRQLQEVLAKSKDLREAKNRLQWLRGDISALKVPAGKPFLAERVLQRIHAARAVSNIHERFWESLFYMFRRVAVATAVGVIILIGFYIANEGILFADNEVVIEDIIEADTYLALE